MTISKFDSNPVLVNINKLKPYRFMEDQTLQVVLTKLNDFLPTELVVVTHSNNLSTKQHVKDTHFDNLSNEELVEINHSSNLFIKELVQFNIKGLIVDNMIERITDDDLFEPK
jgi:hypothetical protein